MPDGDDVLVERHLRELSDRLRGPRRLKADLLTEARHGLLDAVEAYRAGGLTVPEAERRAVAEFGDPAELAPAFQAELAVGALRGLSLRVVAMASAVLVAGDLTWRGSSWSEGARPPAGYLLLSASLNWIWAAALVLAAIGLLFAGSGRFAALGSARLSWAVGTGLAGLLTLGMLAGAALFGWSFGLWEAALTWPPMVIGAVLVSAGYLWLGRATGRWLRAAR